MSTSSASGGHRPISARPAWRRPSRSCASCGRVRRSPTGASTSSSRTPGSTTRRLKRCRSSSPPSARWRPNSRRGSATGCGSRAPTRTPSICSGRQGGTGPVWAQTNLCWADDREKAIKTAHRIWPNTGVPGQLSQDLSTPALFEQASQNVTPEMVAESVPCGPDAGPVLENVQKMIDAGIDHIYFHQIGPDQEGFCAFWEEELQPKLRFLMRPVQRRRPGSARRALQRLRRPHSRPCRSRRSEAKTRFGTAGAPAPSPAAQSTLPIASFRGEDPVRHGGRSSAFAGRIKSVARPRAAPAGAS